MEVGPAQQRRMDPGMSSLEPVFQQNPPPLERSRAHLQDQPPRPPAASCIPESGGHFTRSSRIKQHPVSAPQVPPSARRQPPRPDSDNASITRDQHPADQRPGSTVETVDLRSHLKRRRQQDDTERTAGDMASRRRTKAPSAWH